MRPVPSLLMLPFHLMACLLYALLCTVQLVLQGAFTMALRAAAPAGAATQAC